MGTFPRESGLLVCLFVVVLCVRVVLFMHSFLSSCPSLPGLWTGINQSIFSLLLEGVLHHSRIFVAMCSLQLLRVCLWISDDAVSHRVTELTFVVFINWEWRVVAFLRLFLRTVGIDRPISRVDACACAEHKRGTTKISIFCNLLWWWWCV